MLPFMSRFGCNSQQPLLNETFMSLQLNWIITENEGIRCGEN